MATSRQVMTAQQLANIGKKTGKPAVSATPAREASAPSLDTRAEWAAIWSARIDALLDSPAKNDAPGRVWRMRLFQDDDYVVAVMVQNRRANEEQAKLITYVNRPYNRVTGNGSVVMQALTGQFSCDEVVAFLRLDRVNPDGKAEWRDETRYTTIALPTSDLVRQIVRRVD